MKTKRNYNEWILPAEWYPQSGIQLTWPHKESEWAYMLDEVEACYIEVAKEIASRQVLLIITPEVERVSKLLASHGVDLEQLRIFECDSNDTWARDHGALTLLQGDHPIIADFGFNGWGLKFAADLDNQITAKTHYVGFLKGKYLNCLDFILEGGSIESDGEGTLLTTSTCLLSPNRNDSMSIEEVEEYLKENFSLKQILWLDSGYLAGDDTDSHIDTLARLCDKETIAYVKCSDQEDEHFEELAEMERELMAFRTLEGKPYKLLPLPMADPIYNDEKQRLPATYANFLIMNKAVLYPTYNQAQNDAKAAKVLAKAFPDREIVGIDCRALIQQHGSLHCITMQYPVGVIE